MTAPETPEIPDLDQIRNQLAEMTKTNSASLRALAAQGAGFDMDRERLRVLLDLSLGQDTPLRLQYERAVQARFAEIIADLQSQVARRTLLAGVNGPVNGNRADRRRAARGK